MQVRWRVKEFLDANDKTPYSLWKASELSRNTVYAIAQGNKDGLEFDTMSKLLEALEKLIGRRIELSDVLEVVR
jgi:DNA-binding Xre family transcriptional regulator